MGAASDELNNRCRYIPSGTVLDSRGNSYETMQAALTYSLDRTFTLTQHVHENLNISNAVIQSENDSAIIGNTIIGNNVTLNGVQAYYDGWTSRTSAEEGSEPSDIPAFDFLVQGVNVSIINSYIHDFRSFFVASGSANFQLRGTIFGLIGWTAPDRGHGHGIYIQPLGNNMRLSNCIGITNFGYGINAYMQSQAISGLTIEDTAVYGTGLHDVKYSQILYGGYLVAGASTFRRNYCLGDTENQGASLEFWKDDNTLAAVDVVIEDNYLPDGIGGIYTAASETGNIYELGNGTHIIANEDDPERWTVIIRNEAESDFVNLDVSEILEGDDDYLLINSQHYLVDRVTGTVPPNKILSIDMRAISHSVATPIGDVPSIHEKCFPKFGVFILKKQ